MGTIISEGSVQGRIAALRILMHAKAIDACIVPTGDPHMSEYISDHYKSREFITGFTGSAGTAIITADEAGLWTDSRYFLQAADELKGSGVNLFKAGLEDTMKMPDFLAQKVPSGGTVSVDGRLISNAWADKLRKDPAFAKAGLKLRTDLDLVNEIWAQRPDIEFNPVFEYPLQYAGSSRVEKLAQIRKDIAVAGADVLVVSMLDETAWLFNLRGSDIVCNPVFFSFALVSANQARLYAEASALPPELVKALQEDGVELCPYGDFFKDLTNVVQMAGVTGSKAKVMLDRQISSERILQLLPESLEIIDRESPVMHRKAVKNPVEMEGVRSAHLKDGVAMCKFLYWLKTNVGKIDITEISAAEKLHEFRAQQDLFRGDSFEAIVGYGPHAAIVHYEATPKTDVPLEPAGMVLIDSGGQYLDGTTDITRTIVLGPVSEREKQLFTAVLRGHIDLARARFPKGLSGANLDYLAHEPLWQLGLDYRHSTGHGVGHYLNVHEDPNEIYWDDTDLFPAMPPFEEGMLSSDEPGYYEDGQFGIRHESLLLCLESEKTEYRQFMEFEEVTLAPFDLEGIVPEQMQPDEIAYLNQYHQKVFEQVGPHLNDEERAWLREATKEI